MTLVTELSIASVGDSHVDMFSPFSRAMCKVPGATLWGLSKESSETKAMRAFLAFLKAIPEFNPLICVGEVDCNSLYWHKNESLSIGKYLDICMKRLKWFLSNIEKKFIISSIVLPPVDTYKHSRGRPHVKASKEERTDLVKVFNNSLKNLAELDDHYYLDISTPTLGKDGLVHPHFIKTVRNTHLNNRKMEVVIREKLNEYKESLSHNQ